MTDFRVLDSARRTLNAAKRMKLAAVAAARPEMREHVADVMEEEVSSVAREVGTVLDRLVYGNAARAEA